MKRVPGGVVSNWMLDHARRGRRRRRHACPAGRVLPRPPGDGDVVAFGAGSGITPVFSCSRAALATTDRRVRLLYANRDRDAVIFARRARRAGRARTPTASRSIHHLDVERRLRRRRRRAAASSDGAAGADVLRLRARARSWTSSRTRCSARASTPTASTSSGSRPAEPVADAEPRRRGRRRGRGRRQVTIELDGRTDTVEHQPGTTILQTARQMGMSPPFSCEAGSCATCMAQLVEGTVKMHVNDVLTDDEVAEGWVLTCQSVPTAPTVTSSTRGADRWSHRSIADIIELEQLLARYAVGMTKDDIDAVIDVFTPDGTYSAFGDTYALADFPTPGGRRAEGPVHGRPAGARARRRHRHGRAAAVLRRPDQPRHAHRLVHRHLPAHRATAGGCTPGR